MTRPRGLARAGRPVEETEEIMSQNSPQNYVNPTRMGHGIDGSTAHGSAAADPRVAPPDAASTVVNPEQEAKRIEKIHAHSSSHHTAGTVTFDT